MWLKIDLLLCLQPELDQAADGFRAPRKVVLFPTPVVEMLRHFGLHTDQHRVAGDGSSFLWRFRDFTS